MLTDLRASIAKELRTAEGWQLVLDKTEPAAQSLSFEYPSITQPGGYIRSFVKIEMGAPLARVIEGLAKDYDLMESMFYRTKRPDWMLILKTIEEFEHEFNAQKETR